MLHKSSSEKKCLLLICPTVVRDEGRKGSGGQELLRSCQYARFSVKTLPLIFFFKEKSAYGKPVSTLCK